MLDYIRPWIDFYKVDLKSMDDKHYRELGGVLQNVLDSIRGIHERGMWLEVLTLTIPGFNDSEEELRRAARFVASVSRDIPWHVTAFHPDYKMTDRGSTPCETLIRAAEIGTEEGLRYVYAGNLPGRVGQWENTRCPGCQMTLIERYGFRVVQNRLVQGACPGARHRSQAAGTPPWREPPELTAYPYRSSDRLAKAPDLILKPGPSRIQVPASP